MRPPALCLVALALALVASAAGAQQAASAAVPQPTPAERSRPLEGRWSIELLLDPRSMQNAPPAEKITGEVAFGSGSWWTNTDRFGRHSVDTRPFFGRSYAAPQNVQAFGAADTSLFTEVSGGVIGDSVGIDFLPRLDHGGLSLWGRFYGDSVRGRWHRRGAEGSGVFVMRRVSRDAVAIAAIPVPSAAPPTVAVTSTTPVATPTPKEAKATRAELRAQQKAAAAAAKVEAQRIAAAQAAAAKVAAAQAATAKAEAVKVAAAQAAAEKVAAREAAAAKTAAAKTAVASAPSPTTTVASAALAPPAKTIPPASVPAKPASSTPVAASPSSLAAVTAPPPAPPRATRPSRTAPIDPTATGSIRVRMFDSASKKYFVTRYQLHLPDGTFKWGNFRSGGGDDGFGPVVPSRPGRYEVEVENFVCGDKFWFFADKVVRPVVVQAGDTTDVSIDVDLSKAPAKKTIDNETGALCTAGPGTPK